MLLRIAISSLALVFLAVPPVAAETLRMPELGYSVELLSGRAICGGEQYDRGVDMFLDGGPGGCDDLSKRPHIGVFGDYNGAFDPDPGTVAACMCNLDDSCRAVNGSKTPVSAPPGLQIEGRPTAVCADTTRDGWIEIVVVVQSATIWGERMGNPHSPEYGASDINYDAMLRTRPERLEADLVEFRKVLKTIRLFPRLQH